MLNARQVVVLEMEVGDLVRALEHRAGDVFDHVVVQEQVPKFVAHLLGGR